MGIHRKGYREPLDGKREQEQNNQVVNGLVVLCQNQYIYAKFLIMAKKKLPICEHVKAFTMLGKLVIPVCKICKEQLGEPINEKPIKNKTQGKTPEPPQEQG